MSSIHAFDFLETNDPNRVPIVVTSGDAIFLHRRVTQHLIQNWLGEDDFSAQYFDGSTVEWVAVFDALSTVGLFSKGLQVVVVREADTFVTKFRPQLEKFATKPNRSGRLILQVDKWLATTKLYKMVDSVGLHVECGVPLSGSGNKKRTDTARLNKWICQVAKQQHQLSLSPSLASLIMELVEYNFDRLDQELAKVSLYLEPGDSPTPALIEEIVGGWRAKTVWQAVEAAVSGDTATAFTFLQRLLQVGEHPLALFGQLAWSLRRYARMGVLVDRERRKGIDVRWDKCFAEAGFSPWEIEKTKQQLKQLGRVRIESIFRWLAEVDLALKGTHSELDRSALVLEKLFAKMSTQLAP
ncbi:MAG TPA: DNA polymerase III subunit delta [Pirellulaceae bacterium]|nr:DNA polymerase III subunit delta [Pirellulaceae bacterium]HMO93415.1 DNA polymerase III subunit delta [Pirellulaceae bacterium]HMP70461.1 DNA polymerase III subunit delta [Pirellulaceae bacterium]